MVTLAASDEIDLHFGPATAMARGIMFFGCPSILSMGKAMYLKNTVREFLQTLFEINSIGLITTYYKLIVFW